MNMHANFPKQQTAAPSRLGWPMLVTLAGLSLVALPSRSFADEPERTEDPESMYRRAILAMDARDYDTACPMLEQITLVLPDGLGAKFTLGECFEEQGRLANAYRTFVAVEKAALDKGQPERSKRAAERAGALLPRLGRITFIGSKPLVSGYDLRFEVDGVSIESDQFTDPHYVDAGTHHVVVLVKGTRRGEHDIEVSGGSTYELPIRELLNLAPREPSPDPALPEHDEPTWGVTPAAPVERRFPVWQVVMGGVGLAAVGAGVAFKLDSVAAERRLVEHCGERLLCPRNAGYDPADDNARKNRSFGLFVGMTGIGAAALGTATMGMILRRPGEKAPKTGSWVQPTFSPTHGGLIFSGSFQ